MTADKREQAILPVNVTWRAQLARVLRGLRAPRGSGDRKYAVGVVERFCGSTSASTFVCAAVLITLLFCVRNATPNDQSWDGAAPWLPDEKKPDEPAQAEQAPAEHTRRSDDDLMRAALGEPGADGLESAVTCAPLAGCFGEPLMPVLAPTLKLPVGGIGLPGLYRGRPRDGVPNGNDLEPHNAGPSSAVVLKALRWLKAHQNADGSWDGPCHTAMSGLALLCFLGYGHTPASAEFGPTVEKAIKYLLSVQTSNGLFAGSKQAYSHAIATYGLAEAYGMTRMLMLRAPLERAVGVILRGQQTAGNWGEYSYDPAGGRKDLSIFSWQVQALKAADIAGAQNEGLQDALDKAVNGLKLHAAPDGGFDYGGPGKSAALTGAGVLCLQFLRHAQDDAAQKGLQAFADMLPEWEKPQASGGTYGWYYTTQARFHNGGPLWDKWNRAILPMLVRNQAADGHWESGSTHGASPVYDTTMCCLCLEVYVRYLPLYDLKGERRRGAAIAESLDGAVGSGDGS